MTDSNSHTQSTGGSLSPGETTIEHSFDLPDDYRTLAAMKTAIETKMTEMQTAGAEALRQRIAEDSAALGMTAEEIVSGKAAKKPRGRKPKQKRDE